VRQLTSDDWADAIQKKISDFSTNSDDSFYRTVDAAAVEDSGTSHVSVLAPNGDAVSVTSTINFSFGSGKNGLEIPGTESSSLEGRWLSGQ
jgi:gamma-glutamyltranspeptidase/glutathione hydrolase/leukotriene-C4 hydrolase